MKKSYFLAFAFCGIFANAQVFDVGSGAQVVDLSNDGTAVGNVSGAFHFIWTEADGGSELGDAGEDGTSGNEMISADGNIISATVVNPDTGVTEAGLFDRTAGEWTYLGGLGTIMDGDTSSSWGMSSNGEYVTGFAWVPSGSGHGVLWNQDGETIDLGSTVANRSSRANGVSADGTRVIGWQDSDFGDRQGVYWENGV